MMWIVQQRFPELYGGNLNLSGRPASSLPHGIQKLKEEWRKEWEEEAAAKEAEMRALHEAEHNSAEASKARFLKKYQAKVREEYFFRAEGKPLPPISRCASWDDGGGDGCRRDLYGVDTGAFPQRPAWRPVEHRSQPRAGGCKAQRMGASHRRSHPAARAGRGRRLWSGYAGRRRVWWRSEHHLSGE
jgi:hypothetical protein